MTFDPAFKARHNRHERVSIESRTDDSSPPRAAYAVPADSRPREHGVRSIFTRRGFVWSAIVATVGVASVQGRAFAQGLSKIPIKILRRTEYPGDKYVCVLISLDLDPGALVPRHMHPGVESSYLVAGSITLSVKGQPDRIFNAGEGYQIPPETPHNIRNGPHKSTIASTLIVEKDKPLVEPASD